MISLIVAMDKHRLIGNDNHIPWNIAADLAYFKKTTMGYPVIMGRKTFESLGRPLPGRTNVVLTRDPNYHPQGCVVFSSVQAVLEEFAHQDIFIIGGAEVFKQFLDKADKLYITLVEGDYEGDTWFPAFQPAQWVLESLENHVQNNQNETGYAFLVYSRL